jgi:hypothetical protein
MAKNACNCILAATFLLLAAQCLACTRNVTLATKDEETAFASFCCGAETTLRVKNLDPKETAVLRIQQGASAGQDLTIPPGGKVDFTQMFYGLSYRVINWKGPSVAVQSC